MLEKEYAYRLKSKLIDMQYLNLSDSEIERCLKNTVLSVKNISKAKEFRDNGILTFN